MSTQPPPAPAPGVAALPPGIAPVAPGDRVTSIDTLRGFALLGILAMNIVAFALPSDAYMNPMIPALEPYQGPFRGINLLTWLGTFLFFDQKMMSIFSMLFGAGLVLMDSRADPGRSFAGVYYRRLLVLLIIGLLHAYLIWYGDILVAYAICGVFLYPVRRLPPAWLIAIGVGVMSVSVVLTALMGLAMMYFRDMALDVQQAIDAGKEVTADQKELLQGYQQMQEGFTPTQQRVDDTIAAMRGSLPEVLKTNALGAVMLQTIAFGIWTFWRALGLMLIGMGLMKLGVFAAARSTRFYATLAGVGLGVGLPLVGVGAFLLHRHGFDMTWAFALDGHFNYIGSAFVALGYVGVVMLVCKAGALTWLRTRLAAVGRTAFSNYLLQSVLMTSIFYGWGLGYFGYFERYQLVFFVLGTWALQLLISPIWLRHFRYGPMEWVWRTLTYATIQPMRRSHVREPLASGPPAR